MDLTNANIFIENNMLKDLKIQVISPMQKPILCKEDKIDFGIKEIFSQNTFNFTIINPSDYPLEFSLFLGAEDYANFEYIKEETQRYYSM